jgi:hypothetical protein
VTHLEQVNEEFKTLIKNIAKNPDAGKEVEELKELGVGKFR